jgi:DNA-binding NarL/FixJ family response regulator
MTRILVIEDERVMRRNLVTLLELENYQVTAAENGRRGVELAKANPPDLIVCDVMMPGLDGYGVLRELTREDLTAEVPFIFLTAKGERCDVRAGMNLGADDYLVKPVNQEELLEAIEARLQRQRLRARSGDLKIDFSSPAPFGALGLTPREAEVLLWIAQGKSNRDIATILDASEGTVKKHVVHILEKLGVETRSAATLSAIEAIARAGSAAENNPAPATPRT